MNLSVLLLIVAVVLFTICALSGFGAFVLPHLLGWEAAGLACFAAAHLPLP